MVPGSRSSHQLQDGQRLYTLHGSPVNITINANGIRHLVSIFTYNLMNISNMLEYQIAWVASSKCKEAKQKLKDRQTEKGTKSLRKWPVLIKYQ